MNDQNLVNKPVDVKQIIEALRCVSAPGDPIGDCEKCPFGGTENLTPNLTPEQAKQLGVDHWTSCDSDRILSMAADRLANDQTHIAALQREIEKLRSGRRWIPVTERLPDKWQEAETREMINYLIFGADFGVDVGSYHAPSKRWICLCLPVQVTHWMPLPEAPEEVE